MSVEVSIEKVTAEQVRKLLLLIIVYKDKIVSDVFWWTSAILMPGMYVAGSYKDIPVLISPVLNKGKCFEELMKTKLLAY